jgi:DNA-binding transcriptional ArsR family regulator
LELIQPVVSRHLKILKNAGLVRCRKDGTKRLYSATDMRIYAIFDAVSPSLVDVLTKEILDGVLCS